MDGSPTELKLIDCSREYRAGEYRELFIVEGDSASQCVARVRDPSYQAVYPMQGKPMNAAKASERALRRNQWFCGLLQALGLNWDNVSAEQAAFDRILLLFDPDADGIHCGALAVMFFDRVLRPLIDANRVSMIRPPRFAVEAEGYSGSVQAFSEDHLDAIRKSLDGKGIRCSHRPYRGLASLNADTLLEFCVDPESRTSELVRPCDVQEIRRAFCYDEID